MKKLFKLPRKISVWIITPIIFVGSIPFILTQGLWSTIRIFSFADDLSGNILLVLGGVLTPLYVVFEWTFDKLQHEINIDSNRLGNSNVIKPIIVSVIPIAIPIILISRLL